MVCWRSLMRAKACPRIRRVTKHSLSDVRDEPLPKKASKVKVKSTGPTRSFDKKGKEVWIVLYAFDLLLMKVKVKETFKVDKFGKIKELTRARA